MRTLADVLESRRGDLVRRWEDVVQREHAPRLLSRPELADHIPQFLEAVIAALRREEAGEPAKPHRVAPLGWEHGAQRLREGFDLDAVVREYGALQEGIFALLDEERGHLTLDEARVLAQCFNRAIAEAVERFVRGLGLPQGVSSLPPPP